MERVPGLEVGKQSKSLADFEKRERGVKELATQQKQPTEESNQFPSTTGKT